jgi:hypothetical protein
MGAWDTGSFENDDALDWVVRLNKARDTSILHEAFTSVLHANGHLETPRCCEAVAAAEVVAVLRGRPLAKLPQEVPTFVARVAAAPSPELLAMAAKAVERVRTKSELRELWEGSVSAKHWLADVSDLQQRLA